MSMTSPRTTLFRGHYAPLPDRSSAAPHSTLPQRSRPLFLRRDLRLRADYFALSSLESRPRLQDHTSLDKTATCLRGRGSGGVAVLERLASVSSALRAGWHCVHHRDRTHRPEKP